MQHLPPAAPFSPPTYSSSLTFSFTPISDKLISYFSSRYSHYIHFNILPHWSFSASPRSRTSWSQQARSPRWPAPSLIWELRPGDRGLCNNKQHQKVSRKVKVVSNHSNYFFAITNIIRKYQEKWKWFKIILIISDLGTFCPNARVELTMVSITTLWWPTLRRPLTLSAGWGFVMSCYFHCLTSSVFMESFYLLKMGYPPCIV